MQTLRQTARLFALCSLGLALLQPARADGPATGYPATVKEIQAILKDARVARALKRTQAIHSITRVAPLSYLISTADPCALEVGIRYVGAPMPGGPVAIEVVLDQPVPICGAGVSVGNN